jgi:hypothetical protein
MSKNKLSKLNYLGADSLVVSDVGLFYIDEIAKEVTSVYRLFSPISIRSAELVDLFVACENVNFYRLTLFNGRFVRATSKQAFYCKNERKYMRDLTIGLPLDIQLNNYTKTEELKLITTLTRDKLTNKDTSTADLGYTPYTTSPTLGYVTGFLINQNGLSLCKGDFEGIKYTRPTYRVSATDFLQQSIWTVFPSRNPIVNKLNSKTTFSISYYGFLCLRVNGLFNLKNQVFERVPFIIRSGSKSTILGFLSGLLDGNAIIVEPVGLSLLSTNLSLLNSIQQVAECVGIVFQLQNQFGDVYRLTLDTRNSLSESLCAVFGMSCIDFDSIPDGGNDNLYDLYRVNRIECELHPQVGYNLFLNSRPKAIDKWFYNGAIKTSSLVCSFELRPEVII